MPVRITVEVLGEKILDRAFLGVEKEIGDLTPIWNKVEKEMRRITFEAFLTEGASTASGKWKPLSKRYAKIKKKLYPLAPASGGILFATGKLEQSLTGQTGDSISEKTKDSYTFGTKVKYFRFHQLGEGKMPKRRIIDPTDEQKRGIQKTIQKSLLEMIRGNKDTKDLLKG